jgi:hypothetical protein
LGDENTLHEVITPTGNTIRLTVQQWAHIVEGHDYMAGNMDKVLETLAEPSRIVEGQTGEALALRGKHRLSFIVMFLMASSLLLFSHPNRKKLRSEGEYCGRGNLTGFYPTPFIVSCSSDVDGLRCPGGCFVYQLP